MSDSLKHIPSQSSLFYDETWNEERDASFIQALIQQKHDGNWNRASVNGHALLWALSELERIFEVNFTWDEVYVRCQSLRQRYDIFKEITQTYGFWWNEVENKVLASTSAWKKLIEIYPSAKCYNHNGENQYKNLAVLFECPAYQSDDQEHEIISVSSGSIPHPVVHNISSSIINISSDDNDEVQSHFSARSKASRKKQHGLVLKDEDYDAYDDHDSGKHGLSSSSTKTRKGEGSSSRDSLSSMKSLFSRSRGSK